MASSYYDSSGKNVVDGDVAYAADLNDINSATDTGFQLVEAAVDAIATNQPYYADLAEKWAENPENTAVEPGKYSALHWAAKAEDDATQTAADRVQTGLDRTQTGLDRTQTGLDRTQTGLDRVATAADRVQTGLDVTAASDFADDAEAAAVISAANARGRNYIINGNFDVWQRATSQTTSGYGSVDRWISSNFGSTKTFSRQSFSLGQTDVPGNPKYYSSTVVTSIAGANNSVRLVQQIESVLSLAGKTATLSFWAKADSAKNIAIEFLQNFGTGGGESPEVYPIGQQLVPLTTVWQKKTVTVSIPSITGKGLGANLNDHLRLNFWFDAGSSFNARTANLGQQSGTFDIAQVQLEEGLVATEFERRTYGQELGLCQRYFENGSCFYYGLTAASINEYAASFFSVTKRALPVISGVSVANANFPATPVLLAIGTRGVSDSRAATASGISGYFGSNWTADAEI